MYVLNVFFNNEEIPKIVFLIKYWCLYFNVRCKFIMYKTNQSYAGLAWIQDVSGRNFFLGLNYLMSILSQS